jgi:hypothetical protein
LTATGVAKTVIVASNRAGYDVGAFIAGLGISGFVMNINAYRKRIWKKSRESARIITNQRSPSNVRHA